MLIRFPYINLAVKPRLGNWEEALIPPAYAAPPPYSGANFITGQIGTFSQPEEGALTLPYHRLYHVAKKKFP